MSARGTDERILNVGADGTSKNKDMTSAPDLGRADIGPDLEDFVTADRQDDWIAADWLVALSDRPDDVALQEQFADWLVADPTHPDQWKAAVRTYRALGATQRSGTATVVRLPRRRRRWALVGAAAALAACLMLMVAPSLVRDLRADFVSGTAEVKRIELPDGSVVQLAPDTAIAVDFSSDTRRVDLIDGIALFEVAPDPARPFSVAAGPATATAIGTAFEVRRLEGLESVAVREGVVSVAPALGRTGNRLEAGQSIRISGTGAAQLGTVLPEQVGIWTDSLVTARERPVADLVAEIRRYYSGLIILRGERLAGQPVTGIFDMTDPARALGLVAASQGAELHRFSSWVLVLDGD